MTITTEELWMDDQLGEIRDLLATVEKVRSSSFPNLDKRLVEQILEIQRQFAEDRIEARKQTEQAISRWASQQFESSQN